jgi:hypothetical protein
MLHAETAMDNDLDAICRLNRENLRSALTEQEREAEGFVTWLYSPLLLQQMHHLAPSVVLKEEGRLVGYALTTLKQARAFHPDLETMFSHLEPILFRGSPLMSWNFYCMGQICIAKEARGKKGFRMLYEKHRELYGKSFDFILTEVSVSNQRSLVAHQKTGFREIHRYRDQKDEWVVIVWEWD